MGEEEDQQQRSSHHNQGRGGGGGGQPSVRFAPTAAICTSTATSPPHLYSPRSNVPLTIKSALKHSVSSTSSSSAASGSTDSGFSLGSFSSADIEGKQQLNCHSPAGIGTCPSLLPFKDFPFTYSKGVSKSYGAHLLIP